MKKLHLHLYTQRGLFARVFPMLLLKVEFGPFFSFGFKAKLFFLYSPEYLDCQTPFFAASLKIVWHNAFICVFARTLYIYTAFHYHISQVVSSYKIFRSSTL